MLRNKHIRVVVATELTGRVLALVDVYLAQGELLSALWADKRLKMLKN